MQLPPPHAVIACGPHCTIGGDAALPTLLQHLQEKLTRTRLAATAIVTLGTVCTGIFGNHEEIEYRLEDYLELFSRCGKRPIHSCVCWSVCVWEAPHPSSCVCVCVCVWAAPHPSSCA